MGIQARENQQELFDLRHERRMLLCALTLSLCGDRTDRAEAKATLLELLKEPALARCILLWADGLTNPPTDDIQEVLDIAREVTTPSKTRVPALIHLHA